MARQNQNRASNHRNFRTGVVALSLAVLATLGLGACGSQNTSNAGTTATASSTTEAIVNAGNGKVTVKASEATSPSPTATASQGTVTVSEGSITVSGADGTGITAEANGNITVNGDSKGSAKANEKAEESSGNSNSVASNSIVSTATGYSRIEIDSDGSWSYHAPNGDIIEVESDGSWEITGQNGVIEVGSNGIANLTGSGPIKVPTVPAKPEGATVNPVRPVTPRN